MSKITKHYSKPKITYSEDYYGDLDLKAIRKSELLAGLANASSHKVQPKSRPTAATDNNKA